MLRDFLFDGEYMTGMCKKKSKQVLWQGRAIGSSGRSSPRLTVGMLLVDS
jgi:hypothetical protein